MRRTSGGGRRSLWITCASAMSLALWLLLAGCGGSESSNTPEEKPAEEKPAQEKTVKEKTAAPETTAAESSDPTRITNNLRGAAQPAFSPDGTKIAFLNYRDGLNERATPRSPATKSEASIGASSDIYVMNADGTNLINLTNGTSTDNQPTWSPDGKKIAFVRWQPGPPGRPANSEIYVVNADGSDQRRLTNNSAVESNPVYSSDGEKIAFQSNRDVNIGPEIPVKDQEIYVMNADGANQTPLTNNELPTHDTQPTFSSDGKKIAFMSNRDLPPGIYAMNADGANQTRLTNNSAPALDPVFSPDGTRIAFSNPAEIYVMNADGTKQTNLTNDAGASRDTNPVFTPDGKRIAFTGNPVSSDEIFVVNVDGSGKTNLTNSPSMHDRQPTFSPDGKKMAFEGARPDNSGNFVSDIYVMNVGGTNTAER